jgi:protein subunit release factor B
MKLPENDDELLAECKMQAYRASGKGGQHVQKTDSAVRLTHIPSGLVVTCQEQRSQYLNKQTCLRKLRLKIEKLNKRKKIRIATRVPRRVKEKTLQKKAHHSEKKNLRKINLND